MIDNDDAHVLDGVDDDDSSSLGCHDGIGGGGCHAAAGDLSIHMIRIYI